MTIVVTIPPATKANRRELCAEICTVQLPAARGGGWVVATYETTRRYASPQDAPVFARMTWRAADGWAGHVLLQTFSDREVTALRELLDTLRMTGLSSQWPVAEWARLESIVHDLAHTTLSTPWEQLPMPRSGRKPRRKRLRWRDETGRRVNIYTDTLQRHAHLPPRTESTNAETTRADDASDPGTAAPQDDPVL